MSKSFRQFKKGDYGLSEAKASPTNLQYLRAKQASNNHFEVRRYIADQIVNDSKLADAYKSLEKIHDNFVALRWNHHSIANILRVANI